MQIGHQFLTKTTSQLNLYSQPIFSSATISCYSRKKLLQVYIRRNWWILFIKMSTRDSSLLAPRTNSREAFRRIKANIQVSKRKSWLIAMKRTVMRMTLISRRIETKIQSRKLEERSSSGKGLLRQLLQSLFHLVSSYISTWFLTHSTMGWALSPSSQTSLLFDSQLTNI